MHPTFAPCVDALERLAGTAAVVALDEDGEVLFRHGSDGPFPAASSIKIALVMTLYADAADGRLALDERVAVGERVDGSGMLRHLRDVESVSLRDLAAFALHASDNTATNLLIDRVTTGRVNERLDEWGCGTTRLQRKMYDFEAAARGHENVMSAPETAALLLRLVRGDLVDRATSDALLGVMEHNKSEGELLPRYLPYGTRVAHKAGWIGGVRNDAGVVWADRPVVAVVLTRDLADVDAAVPVLGLVGWCAWRCAGGDGPALPSELGGGA